MKAVCRLCLVLSALLAATVSSAQGAYYPSPSAVRSRSHASPSIDLPTLPPALPPGLVHYWKMEEASGNRADSVGSSHLAPTGAPGAAAGIHGNAAYFTTMTGQYLSIAASPLAGLSDLTMLMWVNLLPSSANRIVAMQWVETPNEQSCFTIGPTSNPDEVHLDVWDTEGNIANPDDTSFAFDQWVQIGWQYDDTTLSVRGVYNGVPTPWQEEPMEGGGLNVDDGAPFVVSCSLPPYGILGLIDEISIYNWVLDPNALLNQYNNGAGVFLP